MVNIKKYIPKISIVILIFLGLMRSNALTTTKPSIMVSFFPLQEFANAVGGDRVITDCLLPLGADPHTWEPRPGDLVKLSKADIFLYLGSGLEPWINDILKGIQNPSLRVIEVSQCLSLLLKNKANQIHTLEHEHEHEQKHDHIKDDHAHENHEQIDPHLWLDFQYDQMMTDYLAHILSERDPEGLEYYQRNAAGYKAKLAELDKKYREGLKKCHHRKFYLAGHSAFGYLAKRYALEQISLSGLSPDAEPSPKKVAKMIDMAQKEQVKAIYFESLASDRTAKVLAQEIGAKVFRLNPASHLTKEELESGITFIDLMERNLENLRKGLICE